MELPGQPLMMHMVTSYLVNDLHNALTAAEKERDLLQEGHRLIRSLAGVIIDNADNPNFVRTKANNILRWIEINTIEINTTETEGSDE